MIWSRRLVRCLRPRGRDRHWGMNRRRCGHSADDLAARVELGEVAIGETQAYYRAAKASIIDLLHRETRFDQQAVEMRAHGAVHLDRAGRQGGEAHIAPASRPDGADDRTIGKDAARARGAIKAGVSEQLADDECLSLLRSKFLGNGRDSAQHTRIHALSTVLLDPSRNLAQPPLA
jgi:hypothetical protein